MTCLLRRVVAAIALAFCTNVRLAAPTDFDGFNDLEILTNQLPGLTFSNSTVLTAGSRSMSLSFRRSRTPMSYSTPAERLDRFFLARHLDSRLT